MNEPILPLRETLAALPPCDREAARALVAKALATRRGKVVVLDDDPTGIQTVHDIYVYTDWSPQSVRAGFEAEEPMFFLLTNSRGFSAEETRRAHREMAANIARAAAETQQDFLVVSRSDSTLRGHYPLETETLREALEAADGRAFDGEIILPFFLEGGRYTIGDVHYVQVGDTLVPAAQTEFAGDKTFGYTRSNLREWVEEKTGGRYPASGVTSVPIELLRGGSIDPIVELLMGVTGFGKVIVNAADYADVEVFVAALMQALAAGKRYLYRSAAALTKVLGGVSDKPLLTRAELVDNRNQNGGLIVVGSHVRKTTQQLEALRRAEDIAFIQFNQHLVLDDAAFAAELSRVVAEAEDRIRDGVTVAVYTRRERFDLGSANPEEELRLSVRISGAVTDIVRRLSVRPNFIIAKGGITSSDVGTRGLGVKRALVLGQILAGVPVWRTGPESKFPGMPYVIFPGNVGDENALYDAVCKMRPRP